VADMDFWEGRGSGEHLSALLFGAPTLGVAYPAERDEQGELLVEVRKGTHGPGFS